MMSGAFSQLAAHLNTQQAEPDGTTRYDAGDVRHIIAKAVSDLHGNIPLEDVYTSVRASCGETPSILLQIFALGLCVQRHEKYIPTAITDIGYHTRALQRLHGYDIQPADAAALAASGTWARSTAASHTALRSRLGRARLNTEVNMVRDAGIKLGLMGLDKADPRPQGRPQGRPGRAGRRARTDVTDTWGPGQAYASPTAARHFDS